MELLREAIEAHRLAVSLGIGHPEVALNVLLGRRPLLLADDHDRPAAELGDATDDRRVIAERAVSMQLLKALEDAVDDVERVRARDVPRELDRLPRRGPRRGHLGGVGDESRLDHEMAVAVRCAARADDAIQHGQGQRLQRRS